MDQNLNQINDLKSLLQISDCDMSLTLIEILIHRLTNVQACKVSSSSIPLGEVLALVSHPFLWRDCL